MTMIYMVKDSFEVYEKGALKKFFYPLPYALSY